MPRGAQLIDRSVYLSFTSDIHRRDFQRAIWRKLIWKEGGLKKLFDLAVLSFVLHFKQASKAPWLS